MPGSLALALAIHAGLIALVYFNVRAVRHPPARTDTITAHFLLVEDKPPAAVADPLPPLPDPPAPVPPAPEIPPPLPPPTAPVPRETADAPQQIVTTTHHDAPTAPVAAASRPNHPPATTAKRAQPPAGGGGAGPATLAHPRYAVNPSPNYPPEARRLKQVGDVLLRVKVSADGSAESVSLKRSSGFPSLDEAALAAVRRWKFEPARVAGTAVPAEVDVPVRFQLK